MRGVLVVWKHGVDHLNAFVLSWTRLWRHFNAGIMHKLFWSDPGSSCSFLTLLFSVNIRSVLTRVYLKRFLFHCCWLKTIWGRADIFAFYFIVSKCHMSSLCLCSHCEYNGDTDSHRGATRLGWAEGEAFYRAPSSTTLSVHQPHTPIDYADVE